MILEKIRQLYPQLTKSQKRLADFVARSYRETAFMTASVLARRLTLNEATVIRFAQRLGYLGYPGFIRDVQTIVQAELRAEYEQAPMPDASDVLLTTLNREIRYLQRAASHITPELALEVQNILRQAERVFVVGQGISASLAQLFSVSLRSLGTPAESPLADTLGLGMLLTDVDERCAVVAISVAPESQEMANALRCARDKGARTLVLACSPTDPCTQAAELAILCPTDDQILLPPVGVIAAVIDAIVQSLGLGDAEKVRERVKDCKEARQRVLPQRLR